MKNIFPKKGERVEVASTFITQSERLLDVGCGDGIISYFIKDKINEIYGIDNSIDDLKKAKNRGMKVKYVNLDNLIFPFEDNFFDFVTCLDVIEHVKNPIFLLQESYRVLKNNGIIIISTPNIRFSDHLISLVLKGKFPKTSEDLKYYDGGHIHFFTMFDLTSLLKKENFKILKQQGIINKPIREWKGRLIEKILGEKFMVEFRSPGLLVIAKK